MTSLVTIKTNFVYNKNKILKDLIVALLKFIVPEEEIVLYTSPDKMTLWKQAFVPEVQSFLSYEEDEYIGDRILKVDFAKYLMKRFPSYQPQYITNIDTLNILRNR